MADPVASAAGLAFYGPDEVRRLLDYDGCIAAVREATTHERPRRVPTSSAR